MTFTYYLDGEMAGSYVPTDAEEIKNDEFTVKLLVVAPSSEVIIGYYDDVRIGPIGQ